MQFVSAPCVLSLRTRCLSPEPAHPNNALLPFNRPRTFFDGGATGKQSEKMMKKLMMLSAVAALMLGGSAYAADANDPTVQIKGQASYKLAPDEFNAYASAYSLSNGGAIKFTRTGSRYWAQLKGGDRVELFAAQQGVFMTAAGSRISFQDEGDSLAIDNYELLPMAVAMHATNVRVIAAR
jgi:hypothetical protein